jgi:mediator of RNA polymerase II transcription subunit 13
MDHSHVVWVVHKLIGVKQKATSELGDRENVKMSPSWVREREDWERSAVDQGGEDRDGKSDEESEDGEMEDIDTPLVSRPSTPPPVYLSLGPILLHAQFQHLHLLPLSTPLRPPGAAVAPTNIITMAALTSIPMPVSPAATMGAASEKSKSLEAAAYTVAKEVVSARTYYQHLPLTDPSTVHPNRLPTPLPNYLLGDTRPALVRLLALRATYLTLSISETTRTLQVPHERRRISEGRGEGS